MADPENFSALVQENNDLFLIQLELYPLLQCMNTVFFWKSGSPYC